VSVQSVRAPARNVINLTSWKIAEHRWYRTCY